MIGMLKFLIFLVISKFSFAQENSSKYKNDFAIFCKSFSRDLKRSLNLYISLEEHMKDFNNIPFYLIVPEKEEKLFKDTFEKALREKIISKKPKITTEEIIFEKCGVLDKIKKVQSLKNWGGWQTQQVVKLCIHKTRLAKHYVTIDSDVYFLKDFSKDLFYENGVLRTAGRLLGRSGSEKAGFKKFQKVKMKGDFNRERDEQAYRYFTSGYIRYIFNAGHLPWHDFVPSFQCFDSEKMIKMFKFLKDNNDLDEVGIIKTVPWEFQWYGTYVQKFHPTELRLISPFIFHEIAHTKEDQKYKSCDPENGFKESYGISYGPHAAGRPSDQVRYKMPDTLKCKIKSNISVFWNQSLIKKGIDKVFYYFSDNF